MIRDLALLFALTVGLVVARSSPDPISEADWVIEQHGDNGLPAQLWRAAEVAHHDELAACFAGRAVLFGYIDPFELDETIGATLVIDAHGAPQILISSGLEPCFRPIAAAVIEQLPHAPLHFDLIIHVWHPRGACRLTCDARFTDYSAESRLANLECRQRCAGEPVVAAPVPGTITIGAVELDPDPGVDHATIQRTLTAMIPQITDCYILNSCAARHDTRGDIVLATAVQPNGDTFALADGFDDAAAQCVRYAVDAVHLPGAGADYRVLVRIHFAVPAIRAGRSSAPARRDVAGSPHGPDRPARRPRPRARPRSRR